jgi:hypothetical protein
LGCQDEALHSGKIPYISNDSARMFRYSEECLRRTSQEELDWILELSNLRNISKSIGKTTMLLGQLQMLEEHCSEMIFNKKIEEMGWFIMKQTVGFTYSPHSGLHCLDTLHLSVCTIVKQVWPETRKSTGYLTHILSVLKMQP